MKSCSSLVTRMFARGRTFILVLLITPVIAYAAPNAYVRSTVGRPWGQTTNESAMDAVFGAGNWNDLRFETVNPNVLFSSAYSFVFLEGSDNNANALQTFLNANTTAISNWVTGGGHLFVNSAPNQGSGMSFGFGVTLTYPAFSPAATAAGPHPIFNGPFNPVGTAWTGSYFAHATVSGGGITAIINGSAPGIVLGEKRVGCGLVLFGGMTTTNFHQPQPQATNLRQNILYYTAFTVTTGNQMVALWAYPEQVKEGSNGTFAVAVQNTSQSTIVNYTMSGNAVQGVDYTLSGTPGQITIPAGQPYGTVTLHAIEDNMPGKRTVTATMTITPSSCYTISANNKASIIIAQH